MLVENRLQTAVNTRALILLGRIFTGQDRPENRPIEVGPQSRPTKADQAVKVLLLEVE